MTKLGGTCDRQGTRVSGSSKEIILLYCCAQYSISGITPVMCCDSWMYVTTGACCVVLPSLLLTVADGLAERRLSSKERVLLKGGVERKGSAKEVIVVLHRTSIFV